MARSNKHYKYWTVITQDGQAKDISQDEYFRMMKNMQMRGNNFARWQADDDEWIFLAHITRIVPGEPVEEPEPKVVEKQESEEAPKEEIKMQKPEPEPKEEKPKKLSDAEILEKMKELSSCTHESESIYFQETSTGTKHFPVCDKCGRRGRYIKADKLTDEQKDNAKQWVE